MSQTLPRRLPVSLALALLVALLSLTSTAPPTHAEAGSAKPNVLFILTDDMRLDEMKYMDKTRRFLAGRGATFTQGLSPHPICCPARAILLTGQYAQSNGVWHNHETEYGGYSNMEHQNSTLLNWMHTAGYETSYIGKYVNGYKPGTNGSPAGLDNNLISIGNLYSPWNLRVWDNGAKRTVEGHQTFGVQQETSRLIRESSASEKPFFIWAGYVAPHTMRVDGKWVPPVPPKGYRTFRNPNDRFPPVAEQVGPSRRQQQAGAQHRARVRSLYAVDDAVMKTVDTLRETGELDNTVIVFASDNGYMMGERDGMMGKNHPYQSSVRIPLYMAGPGIEHREVRSPVTLVDLPTTLAGIAGATPTVTQDGRDAFSRPLTRAVLIQAGFPGRPWVWKGVYTRRHTLIKRLGGSVEVYDRGRDPGEVRNLARRKPRLARHLSRIFARLDNCVGEECQQTTR